MTMINTNARDLGLSSSTAYSEALQPHSEDKRIQSTDRQAQLIHVECYQLFMPV